MSKKKKVTNPELTAEKLHVWKQHLLGFNTHEIAEKMDRHLRWVQIVVKEMREKTPAAVETKAVKETVRFLHNNGVSVPAIIARIKCAFHRVLKPSDVIDIVQGKTAKKPCKKACKCSTKAKKPTIADLRKKFPAAKATTSAVGVTTKANKKVFKKAVCKLNKQCKCKPAAGRQKYVTFNSFLLNAISNNATITGYCKAKRISVNDLISRLTLGGLLSQIVDRGIKDGTVRFDVVKQ